jgi:ribokinase
MTRRPVVVLGSLNIDLVVRAARAPLAGETLIAQDFAEFAGGKGLNQAVAARRAGAAVTLVGRIGADDMGARLRRQLLAEGIDAGAVGVDGAGTGVALIVVESGGGNRILVVPRANGSFTPADAQAHADTFRSAAVLLLQGEVPLVASLHAARLAVAAGVPVVFNPAPVPPPSAELDELLSLSRYVVPNETEVVALAGGSTWAEAARALRPRCGGPVIATLGGTGALVVAAAGREELLPAFPVEVVDTVGAGDAFVGAFAAALAAGAALGGALRRALAAGALACTRPGALPSMPRREEMDRLLAAHPDPGGRAPV